MRWLICFLFFFICMNAFGFDKMQYDVFYARTSSGIPDPEAFRSLPPTQHLGLENGICWFKVVIKNQAQTSRKIIIQIATHNLDTVELLQWKGKTMLSSKSNGDFHEDGTAPGSRFPTFSIETGEERECIIFLKTNFRKDTNFPVRLYEETEYYQFISVQNTWSGLYYGILLAVIIFNLFFYFKFHDEVYLYYTLFLIAYTLAMFHYDGLARFINVDLEFLAHLIIEIAMFVFSFKFLELNHHVPRFKKYAIGLTLLMGVSEIIFLITKSYIFFALADVIAMCSFFIVWMVSFTLIKKVKYAKFYILGYFILIVCGYYYVLSYNFGIYRIDAYTFFFKIASGIDMLIFTYAITFRMDILTKEYQLIIAELKAFVDTYQSDEKKKSYTGDPFLILLSNNELSEEPLTKREIEILKLIYQGYSNKDIADALFVSLNTIKYHVRNIYQKLDIKNRHDVQARLSVLVSP